MEAFVSARDGDGGRVDGWVLGALGDCREEDLCGESVGVLSAAGLECEVAAGSAGVAATAERLRIPSAVCGGDAEEDSRSAVARLVVDGAGVGGVHVQLWDSDRDEGVWRVDPVHGLCHRVDCGGAGGREDLFGSRAGAASTGGGWGGMGGGRGRGGVSGAGGIGVGLLFGEDRVEIWSGFSPLGLGWRWGVPDVDHPPAFWIVAVERKAILSLPALRCTPALPPCEQKRLTGARFFGRVVASSTRVFT